MVSARAAGVGRLAVSAGGVMIGVPRRRYRAVAALSAVERDEHRRLAAAWGCSLSDAVRRALHEALVRCEVGGALVSGFTGDADEGLFG